MIALVLAFAMLFGSVPTTGAGHRAGGGGASYDILTEASDALITEGSDHIVTEAAP